ncbi:type I-U CRISPR-associated helicase/endonuclease Cas3 [uncultured Thiohalocapsa sp.]|uniref:type I-G CRISPR-associated helicase/endonuclease Cas3g n=1 Tax=uncultured Thiohalocapsa sp. TaxID=768990 RepID=UPI0025F53BB7|nr:type I-U CRISPR-associated helicase/endonuclease Cas3 [uncultured Thiohalocapsa sp.]
MNEFEFQDRFERLTDHQPLPWQTRLFLEYFDQDRLPAAVDVPTGLGKTAVTALWLIAIRAGRKLPRRLVYVVDRRAVVDQATAFVENLCKRLPKAERFPISTLRGQHIDNREWLDDPAQPAIIVGTVDMIGSRLLFSGYGVSRKMRPYHAGLLGADTLVVLDEAHLVPPFERLLEAVESGAGDYGQEASADLVRVPPLRLLSLSATGRGRRGEVFALRDTDLGEPGSITRQRLDAKKSLEIRRGDPKQRPKDLADAAWGLSGEGTLAMRCLVYCNSRDDAEKVHRDLAERVKKQRKAEQAPPLCEPELFIGARRGHERQLAADSLAALGFLADARANDERLRFLVATSAGEVGVDLDADHMVCDLVAWERMVQRLGRVNRRGTGDARVVVLDFGPLDPKSVEQGRAHAALKAVMEALPDTEEGFDASPGALRVFKLDANDERRAALDAATTPAPLRPALNRPLVDAWSMTTLREHTGRPEVQPWLRGWVDDQPQTAVVWRAHLPVAEQEASDDGQVRPKAVDDYFEAAPPHAAEKLETESYRVAEWLIARAKALLKVAAAKANGPIDVVVPQPQHIIAIALGQAGDFERAYRLRDLDGVNKDRLVRELAARTLVVSTLVGGLAGIGTLDAKHADAPTWVADDDVLPDIGASSASPVIPWRVLRWSGTEDAGLDGVPGWHRRHQFVLKRDADGETSAALDVYQWRQTAATEDDRSLGYLQTLADHQACAEAKARAIAERLGLTEWATQVLVVAARLHDEGKRADRWQTAFRAPRGGEPYAKTKGPIDQQVLDGYRHELGSLFHAEQDAAFQALAPDQRELVLHLIAAHHGQARPTIVTRGCEEAPPSQLDARARDVALRFVRLQHRWGPWGLAWWEALLRAADQQASKAAAQEDC